MDELGKHCAEWKKPDIEGHVMIPFIGIVQNRQIHRDRLVLERDWERGMGNDANEWRVSFWGERF